MRPLLAALLCVPLLALAEPLAKEPENVAQVRADFFAAIEKNGMDVKACSITYMDSGEAGHLIEAKCSTLPLQCLLVVHPTEALAQPLACAENPDYKPSTKI